MIQFIYMLNLILVIIYIIFGIDDFIWDIFSFFSGFFKRKTNINRENLFSLNKKHIALTIAAWQESNVIEDVIYNIIKSQTYPTDRYSIFIGAYPNDLDTIEAVKRMKQQYKNVFLVINKKQGPTTKAQNLNYVFSEIRDFEKEKNIKFSAITIHDAEDIVHPYELLVTNYLIDKYSALQFPVFPLMRKPTFKNFFHSITSNTYADEFAENHYIALVNRHLSGGFVPSAGTGFSLRRDVFDNMGYEVLPEESLTEDYKLSLNLYEKGIQMYYVLERVNRVSDEGKIYWDYIATRSIFPSTLKTAIKQKTRWITGITMQSYQFRKIAGNKMSFVGKYSVYKDQKAKISNLISPLGYPIILYIALTNIFDLKSIHPNDLIINALSIFVLILALNRQIQRGISLYNIYGLRSMFFGVLFPPLLPLRLVWGNLINFVATVKAYYKIRNTKKVTMNKKKK